MVNELISHCADTVPQSSSQEIPPPEKLSDLNAAAFESASSKIGAAVRSAIESVRGQNSPEPSPYTFGSVERILQNSTNGADAIMSQVAQRILSAENEVCIQTYILDIDSPAAKEIFQAVATRQAQRPNLKVFILFNDAIGRDLPRILSTLQEMNVRASAATYETHTGRDSMHAKCYIIDGKIAFTGGDNVDNPKEKDSEIAVEGPVVKALLKQFDETWLHAFIQRYAGAQKNIASLSQSHAINPATPKPEHPLVPMTVLTKQGIHWLGRYYDNEADQALLAAIGTAKSEVKIASPNVNDPKFLASLIVAANRGVHVKILAPRDYESIFSLIDHSSNNALVALNRDSLLKTGHQMEIRWFSANGVTQASNHTKFISIDGTWAYVGSQNADCQSWRYSRELGVGIDDADSVQRLDAHIFDGDWERSIPAKMEWIDGEFPRISPANDTAVAHLLRIGREALEAFVHDVS